MLITSWKCGAPCRTAGRPLAKLPEDHWQNCRQNRRKTAGRPLAKLSAKPLGNRRETPRFGVTFASLNKGLEWPGRASPTSFFGLWGGLP